ncbi:MAG TPA: histidine kinase [Flavobacterium sp.]|nr:histidine kinase [Flavobacterium sp.]
MDWLTTIFLQSKAIDPVHSLASGILVAILFMGVLGLFCAVLIKLYANKIRKYTRLMYQKELESQKAVNMAMLETQEKVLSDISQDLHDDAGQQLTYINFQLEHLKLDAPNLAKQIEPVSQSVAQLAQTVRSISHSLSNQLLLQQDLFKAIVSEAERISKHSPLNLSVTIEDKKQREFDQLQTIIIYRIFQEAVNNCLKHGKPANILITLKPNPFVMTITDDGCGFDPNHVAQDSLGLLSMRRRAQLIGFEFTVESSPGQGATVRLIENN